MKKTNVYLSTFESQQFGKQFEDIGTGNILYRKGAYNIAVNILGKLEIHIID